MKPNEAMPTWLANKTENISSSTLYAMRQYPDPPVEDLSASFIPDFHSWHAFGDWVSESVDGEMQCLND